MRSFRKASYNFKEQKTLNLLFALAFAVLNHEVGNFMNSGDSNHIYIQNLRSIGTSVNLPNASVLSTVMKWVSRWQTSTAARFFMWFAFLKRVSCFFKRWWWDQPSFQNLMYLFENLPTQLKVTGMMISPHNTKTFSSLSFSQTESI